MTQNREDKSTCEAISPTQLLRDEHVVILRVLDVLQEILFRSDCSGETDYQGIGDCVTFFQLFADICHHGKEEDVLFPELEAHGIPRQGGPIAVMLHEHRQGRALVTQMSELLEPARRSEGEARQRLCAAGRSYVDLLRQHIEKEDHCLFAMAEEVLDATSCRHVCNAYSQLCNRKLNGYSHAQLEELASQLEQRLNTPA